MAEVITVKKVKKRIKIKTIEMNLFKMYLNKMGALKSMPQHRVLDLRDSAVINGENLTNNGTRLPKIK